MDKRKNYPSKELYEIQTFLDPFVMSTSYVASALPGWGRGRKRGHDQVWGLARLPSRGAPLLPLLPIRTPTFLLELSCVAGQRVTPMVQASARGKFSDVATTIKATVTEALASVDPTTTITSK